MPTAFQGEDGNSPPGLHMNGGSMGAETSEGYTRTLPEQDDSENDERYIAAQKGKGRGNMTQNGNNSGTASGVNW